MVTTDYRRLSTASPEQVRETVEGYAIPQKFTDYLAKVTEPDELHALLFDLDTLQKLAENQESTSLSVSSQARTFIGDELGLKLKKDSLNEAVLAAHARLIEVSGEDYQTQLVNLQKRQQFLEAERTLSHTQPPTSDLSRFCRDINQGVRAMYDVLMAHEEVFQLTRTDPDIPISIATDFIGDHGDLNLLSRRLELRWYKSPQAKENKSNHLYLRYFEERRPIYESKEVVVSKGWFTKTTTQKKELVRVDIKRKDPVFKIIEGGCPSFHISSPEDWLNLDTIRYKCENTSNLTPETIFRAFRELSQLPYTLMDILETRAKLLERDRDVANILAPKIKMASEVKALEHKLT